MRRSRTGQVVTLLLAVCTVAVLLAPAAGTAAGASVAVTDGTQPIPDPAVDATTASTQSANAAAAVSAAIQSENGAFTVSSITVENPEIAAGEAVRVEAVVENDGSEPAAIETSLELDGEVVETKTPEIQPEFPVVVRFEVVVDEAGTYAVSVNGVEAGTDLVVGDGTDGSDSDGANGSDGDGTSGDGSGEDAGSSDNAAGQFEVVDVRLDPATVAQGETVLVIANISNRGEQPGDFETTLELGGEVVDSEVVPQILPNSEIGARQTFEYAPNATGTYNVSVSGTQAGSELVVEAASGGGGGLFGFLGFLGFLPLGLLRTVALFVGLPLLLVYLALKALAIYLGY